MHNSIILSKLSSAIDSVVPHNTDLIVLAGFMPILSKEFCQKWSQKIINTHPSLLPKYGGIGMYGVKVQEAVMSSKEKYAGCSVHYVNEKLDNGQIILQKSFFIKKSDNEEILKEKTQYLEYKAFAEAVINIYRYN